MEEKRDKTRNNRRWRRFDEWDQRMLHFDLFAQEDDEAGFAVFKSRYDPEPSVQISKGRVLSMDGKLEREFDIIDEFIARRHLDLDMVEEAMALDDLFIARMLVDINVPRQELERLARGMTPAKLARVVAHLSALEISFAYSKMRQRYTPGNQAHVTNAKDDPLQLAADAAIASALGFDEIETTMRVSSNSWLNALACTVGAAVGRGDALFQCSIEEAEELQIGLAGLASYAETISVYGTEAAFIDGDDTPWSKALLTAAYASRGIKARCTSGAGAELLMGYHEKKSVLYLEARCLCLQRAMGVQGTQNGGVDGAALTASMPGGVRELMAENLIAVWLGLECASGNDVRTSESEIRVGAKITPFLLSGSDLITSGFGSINPYDNSFNAALFNGGEIEDYLALQRDFEVDGGLCPLDEERALTVRIRAVEALSAVLEELELGKTGFEQVQSVIFASGSDETTTFSAGEITKMSQAIKLRSITAIEVIKALAKRGYYEEAENLLFLQKERITGDYLQTSAIFRDHEVLSSVNDPNEYSGPGTAYAMDNTRWEVVKNVRGIINKDIVLAAQSQVARYEEPWLFDRSEAKISDNEFDVVIGVSPAFGIDIHQSSAGHSLEDVLGALIEGIESEGAQARIVRVNHTVDTSFIGLSAARLAGSSYAIGIQAKGTAVLHQADRLPHMNLELFSNAPITSLEHYLNLGLNAGRFAKGETPEPVIVPFRGEALSARHHARVAMLFGIEVARMDKNKKPIELEWRKP